MLEDIAAKHRREQNERSSQAKSLESEIRKSLSQSLVVLAEYSRESGWGRVDRLTSHYPFGAGESEPVTALIVDLSPPSGIYRAPYVRFAAWFQPRFLGRGMTLKCKVEVLPEDSDGWWAVERLHYWSGDSAERLRLVLRHAYDRLASR